MRHIATCDDVFHGSTIQGTACDQGLKVAEMVDVWRCEGFRTARHCTVPNDVGDFLSSEFRAGRPVQAWVGGVHGIMIYGIQRRSDNTQKVLVMDPMPGYEGWQHLDERSDWTGLWSGLDYADVR